MTELELSLGDSINFLSTNIRALAETTFCTSDHDAVYAIARWLVDDYNASPDKTFTKSKETRHKTNCAIALLCVADAVAAYEAFDFVEALGRFGAASMFYGAAGGEYAKATAFRQQSSNGGKATQRATNTIKEAAINFYQVNKGNYGSKAAAAKMMIEMQGQPFYRQKFRTLYDWIRLQSTG